jgi:hypothetical protein
MHNARSRTYTHAHKSARTVARALRPGWAAQGLRPQLHRRDVAGVALCTDCADLPVRPPRAIPMRRIRPSAARALRICYGCMRMRSHARALAGACVRVYGCRRVCLFVCTCMRSVLASTFVCCFRIDVCVCVCACVCVCVRRGLFKNAISGTLPASLSALTALKYLCARHARCRCGASVHLLHVRYVSPMDASVCMYVCRC